MSQAQPALDPNTMSSEPTHATEFTGERVIPGHVEDDLWAEHIARYAFAARFSSGRRVLDVGCGTGYGTAELARNARAATGIDNAADAIEYAAQHYPSARFSTMLATALTFPPASFDLITAFELIEHIADWPTVLSEANRVLDPRGLLIVSTPNKLYYAETRGESGPNPFHEQEFEYAEYHAALSTVFPHVRILLQDRLESFAFYEPRDGARADGHIVRTSGDPTKANFFIAVCSQSPLPGTTAFLYVPNATNLLRERERHVAKLQDEVAKVHGWQATLTAERDELLKNFRDLQQHLEEQNKWATDLEQSLQYVQSRVVELQDDYAAQQAKATEAITALREDLQQKIEWAQDRDKHLNTALDQLQQTVVLLDEAEATVVERTKWAQDLNAEAQHLSAQLDLVRQSRWMKLGRKLGIGPKVTAPGGNSNRSDADNQGIPD